MTKVLKVHSDFDPAGHQSMAIQQAVEGFSTFVISYYAMGLLEIMLEAGIAANLLAVNPKIVLGVAAPIVFFSVWALTRWTRKRVTRTPE